MKNKDFHPVVMDRKALADMHLQIRRMCHDLNAPIRAIHGFAEILLRREAGQLSERGNMYLHRMVAATHTLEQTVGRLHQYARLATHQPNIKSVAIAQLTGEVIAAHYRSLPEGTKLQWDAEPALVWQSDPVLLEILLRELLDNALLYTREGVPAQVEVIWRKDRDRLVLTVSDNGIGIAPEYRQRVFDLFERLHNREAYPGAGAGLTMVLMAASLLGGTIELASDTGLGTTMQILLPQAVEGEE